MVRVLPALRFLLLLAVATAPLRVLAQTPFVGPRSAGMGGAAVGVADDGTALWTNPAGLARDPRIDIEIFGSAVATNRGNFTGTVQDLSTIDLDRIRQGLDLNRIPGAVRDLVSLAQPGTGVVGSGTAGLVFGKSGFALGIGEVAYAGVYPTIDLVNVLPPSVDPARSFHLNQTALSLAGLEAREARLGYGASLFSSVLYVGGAIRYIQGRTYFVRQSVFETDLSDPIATARQAFEQNRRDTSNFAVDLGAMLNLAGIVRVGLVSTAINEPEFDVATHTGDPTLIGAPKTLHLPRTLRSGVAVQPIGMLLVAIDYDLIETDTLVPDAKSRQLSAGVELKLPLFAIRVGGFHDSAAIDPHWAYSAGFGLGLKMLSVNASVVFSTKSTSLSSSNYRDLGGAIDARFRF